MNVQINLNNVSNFTLKGLVNDGVVKLESFDTDKIINILTVDKVFINVADMFSRMDLSPNTKKEIFEKSVTKVITPMFGGAKRPFISVHRLEDFAKLFACIDLFGINVTDETKKVVAKLYVEYLVQCNTYATEVSIHPKNLPDWLIKMMPNDYNGIQHRIAMYKAGNWMNYNPNNPDSRVQVRAAYADHAGTKKGQAIHDNAYSLRKRAVREHNLKLVSKK